MKISANFSMSISLYLPRVENFKLCKFFVKFLFQFYNFTKHVKKIITYFVFVTLFSHRIVRKSSNFLNNIIKM